MVAVKAQVEPIERRLFSIAEFEQMIDAGIFSQEERLELLEGEIVTMRPIGDMHMRAVYILTNLFLHLYAERKAGVSTQNAIKIGRSRPQPDLALLKYDADIMTSFAKAEDVLLVVEVSDTTLRHDQTTKLRIYAAGGIPEYWIVDVNSETVTQYWKPEGIAYSQSRQHTLAQQLTSIQFPTFTVALVDIFGKTLPAPPQLQS